MARSKWPFSRQKEAELYGWDGFYGGYTTEPSQILSRDEANGELWQGGTPSVLSRPWDMVVGMEHESTPNLEARVRFEGIHIWHPINDWDVTDPHAIRSISALVADRVELGDRVLVHCSAGLNRSGLVNGRALMWLGYTADEAINLIRRKRYQSALCNPKFVKWLHEEEAEFGIEPRKAG